MDSLHKGGGFKTIYMRKGAIEKNLEKNAPAPSKREGWEKWKIQSTIESSILL